MGVPQRRPLNETQKERAIAFANVHRAYAAVKERRLPELDDARMAALTACLEVGVPNATLAELSGLSHGRIHQLIKKIGGKPDLRDRLVPE
jgi:hypothetical protein